MTEPSSKEQINEAIAIAEKNGKTTPEATPTEQKPEQNKEALAATVKLAEQEAEFKKREENIKKLEKETLDTYNKIKNIADKTALEGVSMAGQPPKTEDEKQKEFLNKTFEGTGLKL